jgi:hypothetical protein
MQLVLRFRKEYASHEMADHIRLLEDWRRRQGEDHFEEAFREWCKERYSERLALTIGAAEVDRARRAYSHLFVHELGGLLRAGVVQPHDVPEMMGSDELKRLLEVVLPLERALAEGEGRPFRTSAFEVFRGLEEESTRPLASGGGGP